MQPMPPQISQPDQTLPPQLGGAGDALAAFVAQLTPEQNTGFEEWMLSHTPEEQQAMEARIAGEFGSEAGDAQRDMTRADALRQGPINSGGYAGGVYVGSSPLEHIGRAMHNKNRQAEYDTAKGARTTAREEQNKRNMDILAAKRAELGVGNGTPAPTPAYQGGGNPFARSEMLRQNR
jgi:hypothetical protein